MTLSVPQIRAHLARVLEEVPEATAVGIHADRQGEWPNDLSVSGHRFQLRWCETPLSARLALRGTMTRESAERLALITPLSDPALGADVLARLARGRVFRLQQWEMVRTAFHAREVDARLARHGWLAELLVERAPADGYPPVPSGVLDADSAWQWALQLACGLDATHLDLDTLLRWSMDPTGPQRLTGLSPAAHRGIEGWLRERTGQAGPTLIAALAGGVGSDLLPLGVVADLLTGAAANDPDIVAARVRFERYLSGQRLDLVGGRRWADASLRVIRALPAGEAKAVLARADQLCGDLYLSSATTASDVLLSGFEARIAAFAQALNVAVGGDDHALGSLEQAARRIQAHASAAVERARIERVQMALRLARWLRAEMPTTTGLAQNAERYRGHEAYVDWARTVLAGGDQSAPLSAAIGRLLASVATKREGQNRVFAEALKEWSETGSTDTVLIGVERVLTDVVGLLAGQAPVLLLVIDGLSLAVMLGLTEDLRSLGFVSLQRQGEVGARTAVAVLPTVTAVSRASLLSGRLTSGGQAQERSAFCGHAALIAAAKGRAPVLLHKADLTAPEGLAPAARAIIANPGDRIVGVVYNAIDDQLDGADQVHVRWSIDDLRLLPALLHEARGAGRVVVVVADHGHVLEAGTVQRPGTGADRWRSGSTATDGELLFGKGRLVLTEGAETAVLPWSERIRYGAKKNGYHGGATPQEALVPLKVLAPAGLVLIGWEATPDTPPDWWLGQDTPALPLQKVATVPLATTVGQPSSPQGSLFDAETAVAPVPSTTTDWISALLVSPVYQAQKSAAARVAPDDTTMRRLLIALSERGGKLHMNAAAQRLGLPVSRMEPFASAARRVLNVDQAPVLIVDPQTAMIELNLETLLVQFELK